MKKLILFCGLVIGFNMQAQDPILFPGLTITATGLVDSPIGEEVDKLIDGDINTKFLDFDLADGMGFIVDLGGVSAIPTAIEVVTANDFPVRDPMNWEVYGSNDGAAFVLLDSGEITCVADRFFSRTFDVVNTIDYQYFQVEFTNACDPSGGTGIASMQLAEVQLFGEVLSTQDVVFKNQVTLSPNPSQGAFKLTYNGIEPLTQLQVYSALGKQVFSSNLSGFNNTTSFNLQELASGVYFVSITAGSRTTVKRLLIN